ncbi:MAG TPA: hypothetical protein VH560_06240 [Polyangia bacterium]|nr:hypothetical protein [Polyangia bacterium]
MLREREDEVALRDGLAIFHGFDPEAPLVRGDEGVDYAAFGVGD